MTFIKSQDGEKISAVNSKGMVVAYIQKNRFGTHGHWRGWEHYKYCYYANRFLRTDIMYQAVYPGWTSGFGYFGSWSPDPMVFRNVQDFKDHYKEVS